MTTFITIAIVGLSIFVPLLFIRRLTQLPLDDKEVKRTRNYMIIGIILWSLFIWIGGGAGLFAYHAEDPFPLFLLPLFLPVLVFLWALTLRPVQQLLNKPTLNRLVGFQFWRVFGAIFFLVALYDMGPEALKISGFGDLFTGILAILALYLLNRNHQYSRPAVWAFMAIGIADLLGVLYIMLAYYPAWSDVVPSSAGSGAYPMIYVVGIVAPIALIFHVLTLRKLLAERVSSHDLPVEARFFKWNTK